MVTFCDILDEAKQKNKNKLSRVRSTDWESALRNPVSALSLSQISLRTLWLLSEGATRDTSNFFPSYIKSRMSRNLFFTDQLATISTLKVKNVRKVFLITY